MRFTEVWGETLKQNKFLKIISILLVLTSVTTGVAAFKLSDRNPLIIERGCYEKLVTPKSTEMTPQDLQEFLIQAMAFRFDSESNPIHEFFSDEEFQSVKLEREEFSRKGMSQMILIHPETIVSQGNKVRFNTERIIMIGTVRSTVPVSLEAAITVVPRSQANPYGIRIEKLQDTTAEMVNEFKKGVSEKNE
jgi:hypothetical protein